MLMMIARAVCLLSVLGLVFFRSACEQEGTVDAVEPGGYLFRMHSAPGVEFVAMTTDSAVVADLEEQLALPADQRTKFIIGPIAPGDGGHNLDWSWHFVPGEWVLTEVAVELCDGSPGLVEADLNYWLHTVGQFCPWDAYVAESLGD